MPRYEELRTPSFEGAPKLQRPLNDALKAISDRLALLEAASRIYILPTIQFVTGPFVGSLDPPFPLRLSPPPALQGATPVGLVLVRLARLDAAGLGGVTASTKSAVEWANEGNQLLVYLIQGVSPNCRYAATFGAINNG